MRWPIKSPTKGCWPHRNPIMAAVLNRPVALLRANPAASGTYRTLHARLQQGEDLNDRGPHGGQDS